MRVSLYSKFHKNTDQIQSMKIVISVQDADETLPIWHSLSLFLCQTLFE